MDTNVVLDVVLEREPFVETANTLFALIEAGRLQGYITATTITNIFYIVRKLKGREVALEAIAKLLRGMVLCSVTHQVIQLALTLSLDDFEDGVQLACAASEALDAIVTRDQNDFQEAGFTVLSAADLVMQLTSE
ncbi:PIN domain-containing protein [Nodosilinea sp. AN01ver1]|uniref:PIN domain-containing protein n=1 Tax=Nodosilinea sp. AN01ver1 TaxID=3423362 RepID=UPI003D31E239